MTEITGRDLAISIGKHVREWRRLNNYTPEHAAALLHTSPAMISHIENLVRYPGLNLIARICNTLGMSVADLFVHEDLAVASIPADRLMLHVMECCTSIHDTIRTIQQLKEG